jgi:hypothetical protein
MNREMLICCIRILSGPYMCFMLAGVLRCLGATSRALPLETDLGAMATVDEDEKDQITEERASACAQQMLLFIDCF